MSYNADDGWLNWAWMIELSVRKAANFLSFSDQKLVVREIMLSNYVGFYRIGEGKPNSWWFYVLGKKLMVAVDESKQLLGFRNTCISVAPILVELSNV